MTKAITWTGTVVGMTCGHCVASVTEEITELPGVESVVVDLASGLVTVVSHTRIPSADLDAAVREAGYALSS